MAIQMCVLWRPGPIIIAAAASRYIAARIDDAQCRSSLFRAAAAHFTEIPAVKLPTLNEFWLSRRNSIESYRIWKVRYRRSVGGPEELERPGLVSSNPKVFCLLCGIIVFG
jgi:hypothetical protein